MRRKYLLLLAALIAWLGISGCGETVRSPAPVLHLGLHGDSATGAMMVGAGDNLWEIAKRYRLPVRDIIELNGIEPPYALAEGQRLKLPPPVEYRARYRDTLYSIANMFGVGVYRLAQVNKLHEPYAVRPGQTLRIPASYRGVAAAPEQRPQTQPSVVSRPRKVREVVATTIAAPKRAGFMWPVRGKVISGYGPKDGGLYNDGINIAAPKGAAVAAAGDGVVAYVGDDLKSYGNLVLLRHGNGMMTAYAHMDSIRVRKGMMIRKGQTIGAVGSTGAVPATQLHFEIRHGAKTYDPQQYLG